MIGKRTLTPEEWQQRYIQQARWTKDLRAYLFQRIEIEKARRVLEVGCGTGAILADLPAEIPLRAGLDVDAAALQMAIRTVSGGKYCQADGRHLPYPDEGFEVAFCHFLLLWVADPLQVLGEMRRVTRSGGAVLALAEPDYGGRIDFPQELAILGEWQMESLRSQGADPLMGRKLAGLFHEAGLESVETGALGGQWTGNPDWEQWELEWAVLESDLSKKPGFAEKLGLLKAVDQRAYQRGERVLFVPTFYAWGRVP